LYRSGANIIFLEDSHGVADAGQPLASAWTSPRHRIRLATRAAHEQVDERFSRYDLTNPRDYRKFLAAHWSVLPGCEALLEAGGVLEILDDWPVRRRTDTLARDMTVMGQVPAAVTDTQGAMTPAGLWGMMYVLEGSRLGGAILAQRVEAGPDATCRAATSYLRHGDGQRLWPTFVAAFDAAPAVNDDFDAVVAGARRTFSMFAAA
jgi:heme oxygenase